MRPRLPEWLDRYDALGAIVGLLVFAGLGALEDFGTPAGGDAWIFSACVGLGAANLASVVLRLRSGEGLPMREPLEVTPRSYWLTVAMTVGATGVVWGIAIGPPLLAALSVFVFLGAWSSRGRVRLEQVRRRRSAQYDGT